MVDIYSTHSLKKHNDPRGEDEAVGDNGGIKYLKNTNVKYVGVKDTKSLDNCFLFELDSNPSKMIPCLWHTYFIHSEKQ